MITAWEVYWITRLDYMVNTIWFLFLLSFVGLVWILVMRMIALDDRSEYGGIRAWRAGYRDAFPKYLWRACVPFVILLLGVSLIPDTKHACVIYLLPKVVNNEQVQKMPETFVKLLNTKMEAWINESLSEKPLANDNKK